MKRVYSTMIVMLCSISLIACTSLQPISDQTASKSDLGRLAKEQLKPLDYVTLSMIDETAMQLVVSAVEEDGISGTVDGEDAERTIPFSQMRSIAVHKKSALKTTGLVVLSAIGAVVLFVALVLATGFMRSGAK